MKSGLNANRHKKIWIAVGVVSLLTLLIAGWLLFSPKKADAPVSNSKQSEPEPTEPDEPAYTETNLQPTIDTWLTKYPATYGIVVFDNQSGNIIGQNKPNESMFAASLYKIFVAYLALEDFQSGVHDPTEILINGNSWRECVDLMIRESNSPCGEAMMAAMGPAALETRLKVMGITNTKLNGIETTATDSAKILELILAGDELNEENTLFLRDAMRFQDAKWRRGLAKGAPEGIWDTKVGWNLSVNYHDIGILTMPDKREFVIAILGTGSGSPTPIADFSSTIYRALETPQPVN